jgi:hypothetical protein
MTDREAQQIVRTVEETWRLDFGGEGRRIWRESMMRYEHDVAMRAVRRLAERQRERPTIADVKQVIRDITQLATPVRALPEPKQSDIPDWVLVWRWARWLREPPVTTPFPQQLPHHQPPYLTEPQYAALRDEWIIAGHPGRGLAAAQVLAPP